MDFRENTYHCLNRAITAGSPMFDVGSPAADCGRQRPGPSATAAAANRSSVERSGGAARWTWSLGKMVRNHEIMVVPWENHRKTMGILWFNGI